MGNCMERSRENQEQADGKQQENEEAKLGSGYGKGSKGVMRIKVVLTKEELEWMIDRLKNKEGTSLEDVLEEMDRRRRKEVDGGWKPSLESIMECPEIVEMDR
ncbi:hypothetical protein RJ641_001398 [Dillenia turbinata]|uniref:Uncharacterized protein n=1 Tax=Dillenia turbinata TaxID=194707 RepID=A0AAN8ZWR5_9MAGN